MSKSFSKKGNLGVGIYLGEPELCLRLVRNMKQPALIECKAKIESLQVVEKHTEPIPANVDSRKRLYYV